MFQPCNFYNQDGKCTHEHADLVCAKDIWSNNCLQAFNSEEIICVNYFSNYQPDVKFGVDNGAKI